jgi:UDP-N-acetylglucosamine 1-carboxyvinyltransferase
MIIAGLVANGVTEIEEIERIDRGYEDVVEKFTQLGADIKRVYTPDSVEILKNA